MFPPSRPRRVLPRLAAAALTLTAWLSAQVQIVTIGDLVTGGSPFAGHCLYGHRTGDANLRQWVFVTLNATAATAATVEIDDGTERVVTPVNISSGQATYVAYARTRWPAGPTNGATVAVVVGGNPVDTRNNVTVGSRRPWTCHLVSDVCTDDVWAFDRKSDEVMASARLLQAELNQMDVDDAAGAPDHARNRYHAIHYRHVEDTIATFPAEQSRILQRLAERRLEVSLFPATPLGPNTSSAEFVQWLLPARSLQLAAPGCELTGVNYQETPALPYGLPTVLAECGVLGASVAPLGRNFSAGSAGPVEYWEGADGSRIFFHATQSYAEAQNQSWQQLIARAGSIYEAFGAATYPWSQYVVFGTYLDLTGTTFGVGGVSGRVARAAWSALQTNHPGAEYPRVESSTQGRFYEALDDERTRHPGLDAGVPVRRGDHGADWEAWPLALAPYGAAWREAMALLPAADAVTAIAERYVPGSSATVSQSLALAHRETSRLADHAWNGATTANRIVSANLRRGWGQTATGQARSVIQTGLGRLAALVRTGLTPGVLAFNKESFPVHGLATIDLQASGIGAGPWRVVDQLTGTERPAQQWTVGGATLLAFDPGLVPPLGFRVVDLVAGTPSAQRDEVWISQDSPAVVVMDSLFHRVVIDATRHQVTSLLDHMNGDRELLAAGRPLGLCASAAPNVVPIVTNGSVATIRRGAAFGEVELTGSNAGVTYTTRVRIATFAAGIDWDTQANGNLAMERGPLFHAGVATSGPVTFVQGPAAVFRAGTLANGGDQHPQAGLDYHAADRFVDVAGTEAGMVVAPSDHFVAFVDGLSSQHAMPAGSVAWPLWGRGWTTFPNEKLVDQNGETAVRARFALLPHGSGHDRVGAYRFASAHGRHELLARAIAARQAGASLPVFSAGSVEPPTAVATTLSLALEGASRGWILRVWDLGSTRPSVNVTAAMPGLGGIALGGRTDLLERDLTGARNDFVVTGGVGQFAIKPRGLGAVRFFPGTQLTWPAPVIQGVSPNPITSLLPGQSVTVTGPGVGTAVAAKVGATVLEGLTPVDGNNLRIAVERVDQVGGINLEVSGATGTSTPFALTAQAPVPPRLIVTPDLVDAGRALWMETGSDAGSGAVFLMSRVNQPFVIPGIITLGIGGAQGDLLILDGQNSGPSGIATSSARNPGIGGGGATLYLQAIVFNLAGYGTSTVAPVTLR